MDNSTGQIVQIQALENGKGLQFLVDEAYKILGNPLVLFNMEYELMVCSGNVTTDDRFWNEIANAGFFGNESIRFFLEECFIDEVANSKKIAVLSSDKLKYQRLYGRVFNGYGNTVADLIMVACDRPLEDGDAMAFEAVCEKLSQEIRTDDSYNRYGILYHEKLICKLLDNDIDEKQVYSGHLSNLYEDLQENLYVLVLDIGMPNADRRALEAVRDFCKEKHPEHKYAVYGGGVAAVVSTGDPAPNADRDLPELAGYFAANAIRIGMSGCFDNLFKLRRYYDQAAESLKRGEYPPASKT